MNKKPKGLKDIWGARLLNGATYTADIPNSCSTTEEYPKRILPWKKAKNCKDYDSFICFFEPEDEFDSPRGIWNCPEKNLETISLFAGVIAPFFPFEEDSPSPEKEWNIFRSRAFSYWLGSQGINVIDSLGKGSIYDPWISCKGISENRFLCISTADIDFQDFSSRYCFDYALSFALDLLKPKALIVYGKAEGPYFRALRLSGLPIKAYSPINGYPFAEEKIKETDALPSFKEPILPHKGIGQVLLDRSYNELEDLLRSRYAVYTDGGKFYTYTIDGKLRIDFSKFNDRVFQVSVLTGYEGSFKNTSFRDIKEDQFKIALPDCTWDEDADLYVSKEECLYAEFDASGACTWLGITIPENMSPDESIDYERWFKRLNTEKA